MRKTIFKEENYNTGAVLHSISCVHSGLKESSIIFIDIETTGFSPKNSVCYLTGIGQLTGDVLTCTQLFADTPDDEAEILNKLMDYIHSDSVLVTYNGTTFDIPFIKERCKRLNIACETLEHCAHIDIYSHVRKLKNLLSLDGLKQKNIEAFCGIDRDDKFNGGELINVYRDYIIRYKLQENEDADALLQDLTLHNLEDVINLANICAILNYYSILEIDKIDELKLSDVKIDDNIDADGCLSFTFTESAAFPAPVSKARDGVQMCISGNAVTFTVPILCGELRHFYSDYKNYFYLPFEDKAIHKSVAAFVDSDSRIKATKENCYAKKAGKFIPYFNETNFTCFKKQYDDNRLYILLDEKLPNDEAFLKGYAGDISAMLTDS